MVRLRIFSKASPWRNILTNTLNTPYNLRDKLHPCDSKEKWTQSQLNRRDIKGESAGKKYHQGAPSEQAMQRRDGPFSYSVHFPFASLRIWFSWWYFWGSWGVLSIVESFLQLSFFPYPSNVGAKARARARDYVCGIMRIVGFLFKKLPTRVRKLGPKSLEHCRAYCCFLGPRNTPMHQLFHNAKNCLLEYFLKWPPPPQVYTESNS